jgi:2-polyprenyl-6-methoxyphenol hydroxylase-like FAD-dependent oxidoreductase
VPRLNAIGYFVKEVRFVGADGRRAGGFGVDVFTRATRGRFVSLARGELSQAIASTIAAETIFGDSIDTIAPHGAGVRVAFKRAAPRDFDLVIGADGLHSNVRRLAFGPQAGFETYLGYKVAAFEIAGYRPRDEDVYVSYSEPGKQVARFALRGDRTLFLFVFRDASPDLPHDEPARKAALRREFGGGDWETSEILAALDACDALYFDRVSQIRMPAWSKDRVALIGDAAYCPSLLAGEGSALAMVGAYVLAGELKRANGDHGAAFARYEKHLSGLIARKQKAAVAFAASFAPRTRFGIALRNLVTRAFGLPFVTDLVLGASLRDDIDLPDYLA